MKTLDSSYADALEMMEDRSVHSVKIRFVLDKRLMVADVKRAVIAADLPQIHNIRQIGWE